MTKAIGMLAALAMLAGCGGAASESSTLHEWFPGDSSLAAGCYGWDEGQRTWVLEGSPPQDTFACLCSIPGGSKVVRLASLTPKADAEAVSGAGYTCECLPDCGQMR